MITVTRVYRFPAAHILCRPELSEAENEALYGQCANPNGHGHDYVVEVTVTGAVDPETGWVLDPRRLDALVHERAVEPLGHRLLNEHEWFRSSVPTAENVVRVLHREIGGALRRETDARLLRVRLRETPRNEFETGEV